MAEEDKKKYDKMATKLKSRDYYGTLGNIRDGLSLPATTKHVEMEALLIFAIKDIYNNQSKADISLMALGLLNSFSRAKVRLENKGEQASYSKRADNFLECTNYIEKTYDKGTRSQKTARNTLDTNTSRYLAKVISSLYEKKDSIDDYLKAAKTKFERNASQNKGNEPVKLPWEKLDHIPDELLPSLQYYKMITSESTPSSPSSAGEKSDETFPDDPSDQPSISPPPNPTPKWLDTLLKNWWKILILIVIVSIFIVAIIATLFGYINVKYSKQKDIYDFQREMQHSELEEVWEFQYGGPLAREHVSYL